MQEETHTQCKLRHEDGRYTICYIPSKYAKNGKRIEIEREDKSQGKWEDGWIVENTYNTHPTKYLMHRERDYLRHRKFSDI